ncbi:PREDICTED: CMP-N-acetylneuraminate-poly-alpha-2,8-sialyltransferase-like [Branchiostoma belcheri]|uniref:CMP-N-acetylneuraminate-poly-alpha-2, 8-sialyltransferase-like n=1 Tax=Branchiostoma belcheri TaxID=7741 RepID=A0A6P4Y6Z1_BRABE|nr:PREDICTED: CMP-N-acetylneuraminate-poly-alpha-2,8-sialyltransferase-like [Branchiostoma belcheri]
MRKHILKFYNPEKHLTMTTSNLQVGQHVKYEIPTKSYFNVTENFYKVVPKVSPLKGRHFNSCAVVGNSGIVLNSKCGQEIDSMDFVIRCNLPPTSGYEKDVGSKSNFTTMNPSVISVYYRKFLKIKKDHERLLRRLRQIGDQILYVPAFTSGGGRNMNEVAGFMLQYNLQIKTAFPPPGINNIIRSIWKNSQFRLRRPSTGAHMYALAATMCDRIHMYGFYPFSTDPYGTPLRYHYYENSKMIKVATHNMPEEFRALQMLHQRGALVLHTEPCQ